MKRYFHFGLVLLFVVLTGCAGSGAYKTLTYLGDTKGKMLPAIPPKGVTPGPGKAFVYFMRPSSLAVFNHFQIWDSDHYVGWSQANSYFAYECDAGKHLFIGVAENKVALDADFESGKTYYVITNLHMGFINARMDFTPVTQGSELWKKVESGKSDLTYNEVNEFERDKWQTAKKEEAQQYIAFFMSEEGKPHICKLNKEDGI